MRHLHLSVSRALVVMAVVGALVLPNSQGIAAGAMGGCRLMPPKQLGAIFGGPIEMANPSHMGAEIGCFYGGSGLHGGGVILHVVSTQALKASGSKDDATSYYVSATKMFAHDGTEVPGIGGQAKWASGTLFVLSGDDYIQVDLPGMTGDDVQRLARKIAIGVIANLRQGSH